MKLKKSICIKCHESHKPKDSDSNYWCNADEALWNDHGIVFCVCDIEEDSTTKTYNPVYVNTGTIVSNQYNCARIREVKCQYVLEHVVITNED